MDFHIWKPSTNVKLSGKASPHYKTNNGKASPHYKTNQANQKWSLCFFSLSKHDNMYLQAAI